MSSYRNTVEKLSEQLGDNIPCHRCKVPTKPATLAQYGAMCFPCYEEYCQHPDPRFNPPARVAPNVLRKDA